MAWSAWHQGYKSAVDGLKDGTEVVLPQRDLEESRVRVVEVKAHDPNGKHEASSWLEINSEGFRLDIDLIVD
jgi:hypothetical protein